MWAQFRTSQSPIDYVRVSGMGVDPMLVNAAQTVRPGRGWWRNLIDLYGAADILVAEVQLQRAYPGGPAVARFIGRHGPDNEIVGGFTLTAPNSDAIPAMMAQGAQRMDQLFAQALAAGRLQRDTSLNLPPPPVQELPQEAPVVSTTATPANPIRFRSAARTSPSIISRWRICARCPESKRQPRSSSIPSDQLCAGVLSRRHLPAGGGAQRPRLDRRDRGDRDQIHSSSEKPPALPPPPQQPAALPPQPRPASQPPGQQ